MSPLNKSSPAPTPRKFKKRDAFTALPEKLMLLKQTLCKKSRSDVAATILNFIRYLI